MVINADSKTHIRPVWQLEDLLFNASHRLYVFGRKDVVALAVVCNDSVPAWMELHSNGDLRAIRSLIEFLANKSFNI